jgi:hypothetical protein
MKDGNRRRFALFGEKISLLTAAMQIRPIRRRLRGIPVEPVRLCRKAVRLSRLPRSNIVISSQYSPCCETLFPEFHSKIPLHRSDDTLLTGYRHTYAAMLVGETSKRVKRSDIDKMASHQFLKCLTKYLPTHHLIFPRAEPFTTTRTTGL